MYQNINQLFNSIGGQYKFIVNSQVLDKTQIEKVSEMVVDAVQSRLNAVQDIANNNMLIDGNDISIMKYSYNQLSDILESDLSMMISTKPQRDGQSFNVKTLPIPVISKQFSINMRQMSSSKNISHNSIDIERESLRASSYAIGYGMEELLFNGAPNLRISGADALYGLRTHPNKINYYIANAWDAAGADIIGDTLKMVKLLNDNNIYEKLMMYISPNLISVLEGDYSTAKGDRTFKERIEAINGVIGVKPSGILPYNEVVIIAMDPMYLELYSAMQPNIIEYSADGNINYNYVVFSAICPIIKFDINNKGGVLHAVT